MIFLLEYDRSEGRLVKFEKFNDSEQSQAENSRLNLELDLSRKGVRHEIVLLQADSEEGLRRTHRRYFESLGQLLASHIGRDE